MNIVGIDLGTTFCAIAKINELGKPEIVPFGFGGRLLPSCVYIDGDKIYVGKEAETRSEENPANYFDMIKRYMDREYYPELDENKRPIEGTARSVNGTLITPIYLQSLILSYIKEDFESRYGKIDKAIVTVPAYFDEIRRNATLEAAKIAGLPVLGLFNEPTSAGLYHAKESNIKGQNLIFDLGGGTFDVTIIDVKNQGSETIVDVKSTLGDHELGGKDFDLKILEEQRSVYQDKKGANLNEDISFEVQLLIRAEEMKKHLSTNDYFRGRLQGEAGNINFEIERSRFEELIGVFAQKVEMLVESLLVDASVDVKDINEVILVGGSSRIPLFREYLRGVFKKEPLLIGNVDEAVVLGAALECLRRANDAGELGKASPIVRKTAADLIVSDVATYSYGTFALVYDENSGSRVQENVFIIPRNSKIPAKISRSFFLVVDNQEEVNISITQGESKDVDEVNVIHNGFMDLRGIPTKEGDEIIVEYSYDINQMMHCTFIHKKSKKQYEVKLNV